MAKTIPDLHSFSGSHFEALCRRCLRHSVPVHARNAATAWAAHTKLGWTAYRHSPAARLYAVCPQCSSEPPHVDAETKSAKKGT